MLRNQIRYEDKRVALAWILYAEDNDERLINNFDVMETRQSNSASSPDLDEQADSINDGKFLNTLANQTHWGDTPASYHNEAGGFSFADGHSEIHKWLSQASRIRVTATPGGYRPPTFDVPGKQDFAWLWERTTVPFRQ